MAFVACDDETSTSGDPGGTAGGGQGAAGPGGSGAGGSTSDGGSTSNGGNAQGGNSAGGSGGTAGMGGAGGNVSCYELEVCDPLIPDSCGAGSACDIGGGGLQCYAPPNPQMLGQACSDSNTCQHGLTCVNDVCREYCCDNGDCSSGTCQTHPDQATITVPVTVCLP